MSDETLDFEELDIGREWVSGERVVLADDVGAFADLTGDRNPVHLDPEFARTTPFRRCIAHGLLGLGLAGGLVWDALPVRPVALLGLREWNFRAPIFLGDVIRTRVTVQEKELQGRGRRGVVAWRVEILSQDGRVVQEGVMTMLIPTARRVANGQTTADAA
ncbi:MaoC family dehydratase [Frigoriglobus tundricola]|uniref:MaoC-like domain-containing protein n=1 Tax=Frigoriglobus tundricola TaxID=2774151 RepID=A0A6M5Z132_9BACT|nr:MaoC/PaaZ C-terminal domain-containing protein [Frigoriglobus tundricola]QJW99153.1 hypothetical protein FTUN_6753 [Frigoriglobus tundricola]